jgi:hypothetical protein
MSVHPPAMMTDGATHLRLCKRGATPIKQHMNYQYIINDITSLVRVPVASCCGAKRDAASRHTGNELMCDECKQAWLVAVQEEGV